MGSYTRHVGALLRRNLLYRKRSWFGSLIQLILPPFMILILYLIKSSLKNNDTFRPTIVEAKLPDSSLKTLSFMDYVKAVSAPRECLQMPRYLRLEIVLERGFTNPVCMVSGINPLNWPVPFLKCDYNKCNRGACSRNEPQNKTRTDLCQVHILALAPLEVGDTDRLDAFEAYIFDTYPEIENLGMLKTFESQQAIDDYVAHPDYGLKKGEEERQKIAVAVILGGSGKDYEYTIRTNSTNYNANELGGRAGMSTTPNTKRIEDSTAREPKNVCELEGGTANIGKRENRCTVQYMYNGALTIQRLVDDFIIHDTGAKGQGYFVAESGVSFVDFPSESYTKDGFYAQIGTYASLLLMLGLLYPVAAIIRSVVSEKELRQKELMKMLSISESAIELTWFISSYSFFAISALLSTVACSMLYPLASPMLLFIFWEIGFLQVVLFSMVVSAVFAKATRAVLVGILFFFSGYIFTLFGAFDTGSLGIISLIALHPMAAIVYGIEIIGSLEEATFGVNGDTYNYTDNPSGFTFSSCIGFLIRNSLFWGYAMWYLNRVFPGDYGQALPWYFPYQKSYWCGAKESNDNLEEWEQNEKYDGVPIESVGPALKDQEYEGRGVHIRGLTKSFGNKTAVDALDLSMYNGQVFSLLGHNGAGKTTTISMLSGMLAPTEGFAIINGKNIRTQMQEIREDLGICLQHDCLFPTLTVKEHLRFFGRIKGLYATMTFEEAEESIDESIRDVALFEKRNTYSKDLSGGMKRKLSLAVAFCGGSKVVFLDEPTSGMDPFSRRFIWNVIRQNRQDRCIILTTHFMDEADLLGDRIGIMAEGHLRCLGSSLFLKKEYGVGYHVTIEKGSGPKAKVECAKDIVETAVPEASVLSDVSSEITFRLPLDSSDKFPSMFADLDKEVESGAISTYGVGITTLDEVFLQVARGESSNESKDKKAMASSRKLTAVVGDNTPAANSSPMASHRSREDIAKNALFAAHVRSLFEKRALYFKRDKKAWACSTILPVLFALFGFINSTVIAPNRNMKPLELNMTDYGRFDDGKIVFPINEAESFTCQPSKCLASLGGNSNFYDEYSYCGNFLGGEEQCSAVSIEGISDGLSSSTLIPSMQKVSSIYEASKKTIESINSLKEDESIYGSLYFTHTFDSVINSTQQLYRDEVLARCANETSNLEGVNCSSYEGLGYVVSTNFIALHASLLYQLLADQTIIRKALGDNEYNIKATIHPLPFTSTEDKILKSENSFIAWFSLVLSFPFIAGTFGSFIVQERMSKAKHLQTVAGVKPSAYWLSSFAWDVMNYQFPLWIVITLMYALGVDSFTTTENNIRGATICIMILFGPAIAGFTYIITFLFKKPSSCNMFIIVFNFFVGLAGAMVVLILRLIGSITELSGGESNLKFYALIVEWILRFVPSFCLAKGLLFSTNITTFDIIEGEKLNAWSNQIMGTEIIFLAFESVIYVLLAIQIDIWSTRPSVARFFSKKAVQTSGQDVEEMDEDVLKEAERVVRGDANNDKIVISELTKQYSNGKVAVNGLSVGIPGGQCFGLLGINGAGKTTTMGILTAEFPPTSGDATLASYSVTTNPEETRKRIGYCPQFDAHFLNLTGLEHVKLYAAIKGIPDEFIAEAAQTKLVEVGLSEYDGNRLSSQYSGGMKRKLSVACATIGNPEIVFLDEPSTGMDPVSRRELWKVISAMVIGDTNTEYSCSVILTTHSMEECEALCPRIAIMAEGNLKCIGSAQHLKNRFGQGFQVELKVAEPTKDDEDLRHIVSTLLEMKDEDTIIRDPESGEGEVELFFNLEQSLAAARKVSGDNLISDKITENDATGYLIFKSANSDVGTELKELAAFCATTMRMKSLTDFFAEKYENSIVREVQDTRIRFEVPSAGEKVGLLFSAIEEYKDDLKLQDYGISQTTLEQVFNMHAAVAEARKGGRDDK